MSLADIRDLVIITFAVLGIGAIILFIALNILLMRKVLPLIDAAKGTMGNIRGTSSFVSEMVVKPIIKVVSFAFGVRKAAEVIVGLSRRKGGRKGG